MVYRVKGAPFRYSGATNVEDCNTAKEVITKAKLNWSVAKCELYAKMPALIADRDRMDGFLYGGDYFGEMMNNYCTFRTDNNTPLGLVKEKYTPVQNIDAFNFFDDAIGKDRAIWQTAGYFGNGEVVFVSAKLPYDIAVGTDNVENYLVFFTSHDGSTGVKIMLTPVRVICQNMLSAAIDRASNYVSFRHTQSVHDNISYAYEILFNSKKMIDNVGEYFNLMNNTKINDDNAADYFAKLVLSDEEYKTLINAGHKAIELTYRNLLAIQDANLSMKKVNVIAEMWNYYLEGIGQHDIRGTLWGTYNAVTGYYSNVDKITGSRRMNSLMLGDKFRKIKAAGDEALDFSVAASF